MTGCGKKMKGGNGAAEFGVATYGAVGAQHAGPDGSIAMNAGASPIPAPAPTPSPSVPSQNGGKRQKKNQKGGKTFLADLVVPAGLVYFQQRATKKRGGKRQQKQQSRKNRGSRKQK
jgi:hypothetical protein